MDADTTGGPIHVTKQNAHHVAKKMPFLARAALGSLIKLSNGSLTIEWPNGALLRIEGSEPGIDARINLKSFDLARRVLKSGDVGVGESYMEGEWDSPDITAMLLLFCNNRHILASRRRGFFSNTILNLIHWRNANTKRGSQRNISAHYDLGNSFYEHWLDSSMTYSSALFGEDDMSLEEAQTRKYANLVSETGITPDDHVLEIGCGWGGFAEYAARTVGCKVTALTISREQLNHAQERMFREGLNEKVDIVFRDYRDEPGRYDKVASIEMFEAVGEKYWPVYFDKLRDVLKPGGAAGLQIITVRNDLFESYRSTTDFIQRYIFPGGMLPSANILNTLCADRGLNLKREHIFGHDYADTLAKWRESFNRAWPEITAGHGFDERFRRMWEFYLHYCEAGFRSENIDVRQMVYAKAA